MDSRAAFALVLHSHIPFVLGHGTWPFGSDWVYEAGAEVYLPLLDSLRRLAGEKIAPRVTVSFTPILMEQLASPDFKSGFVRYLEVKRDFARDNVREMRLRGDVRLGRLADSWEKFYGDARRDFADTYKSDILGAFRELQEDGQIEVMTSAGTHPYLPLLDTDGAIRAQLRLGVATYEKHFGRRPRGMWLPECAYRPAGTWFTGNPYSSPRWREGLEVWVADAGLEYFVVDAHLLSAGEPMQSYIERFEGIEHLWRDVAASPKLGPPDPQSPAYHVYGIATGDGADSGVSCYVRDPHTAVQVWSARGGYPGDPWYLDFHKKHEPGGHRFWRITDSELDIGQKEPYEPEKVQDRLYAQAVHFIDLLRSALLENGGGGGRVLTAPFDTELFGHWWFEGIRWIEELLRRLHHDPDIHATTLGEYKDAHPPETVVRLGEGSWGENGSNGLWFNEETKWTWARVHRAEIDLQSLLRRVREAGFADDERLTRVLRQAARELLLAQSSDWQFLISNRSAHEYSEQRLAHHADNFDRLAGVVTQMLGGGEPAPADLEFLEEMERLNAVFEDLDLAYWE